MVKETQEGTATVIDGSDDEWRPEPCWLYLDTVGYLNILDGDGSLKANGEKDDATKFEVRIMGSDPQIVMLQHINTEKVVAIKKEKTDSRQSLQSTVDSATVITKYILSETFKGFKNLKVVEDDHPDILFQKIPRSEGSELFYLKPCDDTRMVGFNPAGDPIVTTTADAESNNHKCLFKIYK